MNRDSFDPGPPFSSAPRAGEPPLPAGNDPGEPPSALKHRDPLWIIWGAHGLRAGWSILLFVVLLYFFANVTGTLFATVASDVFDMQLQGGTASSTIVSEGAWVSALAVTLLILSRLEHRRLTAYYLAGTAVATRFLVGLVSGFAALSALVGLLAWGGWIHFYSAAHFDSHLLGYAGLWAIGFLFVGLTEEGSFRCYLQFTLARGINFWWALASIGGMCLWDLSGTNNHGAGGVYAMAGLGVLPCLYLHLRKAPESGFWQAAWVSSTLFGFIHTGNKGETWIGIFAAAAIGFVFCVSVRLTGSAWWAIGCHTAWDWAETYFYGTADSGFEARGHLLTTIPAGSALWSGGSDGPEGSPLVLLVILLLLALLLILYGRKRQSQKPAAFAQPAAS